MRSICITRYALLILMTFIKLQGIIKPVMVQLIMFVSLIAAVIFYFYRRSRKLQEMETEERLRDLYR